VYHCKEITAMDSLDHLSVCVSGDASGMLAIWSMVGGGPMVPDSVIPIGQLPVQCVALDPLFSRVYAACGSVVSALSVNSAGAVTKRDFGSPVISLCPLGTRLLVFCLKYVVLVDCTDLETVRVIVEDDQLSKSKGFPVSITSATLARDRRNAILGLSTGDLCIVGFD